ncbi:MAG: lactate utilization protein [Desulfobacteraceae bacterium]|nr:lactate utilization protein [Desulfobacteraceae bacterium]
MKDSSINSREEILTRLKAAARAPVGPRPVLPPAREYALDAAQMQKLFVEQLKAQGGVAHSVSDSAALRAKLAEICRQEGISRAMAATDEVVETLDLKAWGAAAGVEIFLASDFPERNAYTQAVFDQVQAGITGADFAVAESGTLVLVHNSRQPRLISLAPLIHFAVVPVQRIVPTYEVALEKIFSAGSYPSQVSLITGPSMTADIQATPFRGMHGPQKLVVVIVETW